MAGAAQTLGSSQENTGEDPPYLGPSPHPNTPILSDAVYLADLSKGRESEGFSTDPLCTVKEAEKSALY